MDYSVQPPPTLTLAEAQRMADHLIGIGAAPAGNDNVDDLTKKKWYKPGKYKATTLVHSGFFSDIFLLVPPDDDDDAVDLILKVAPKDSVLQTFYEFRMMRQEPAIHQRLLAETTVPVAPILQFDFSRRVFDRDFMIMKKLKGVPLCDASLSRSARTRVYQEWGEMVAQIHSITDKQGRFGYLRNEADSCMEPKTTWKEAFQEMYSKLLTDIVDCGMYTEAQQQQAMDLFVRNSGVFGEVENIPHLLHGDLWVNNLLVEEDEKVSGVLDFDRACWGDIEWDIAIAEYCGITNSSFWKGYTSRGMSQPATKTGSAAVRRLFYHLYEHQKYIVICKSSRRNFDDAGAKYYVNASLSLMQLFQTTGNPNII